MDTEPTMPALSDIRKALTFWDKVAEDNGWTVGSLTIFVDEHGCVTDTVAIQDGDGFYVAVDTGEDEDDG